MSKWGDLAPWVGPSPNQGGKMSEWRGLVVHIASGYFDGTISWQLNPEADVSSHFIGGRDGRRAQMVDTDTVAWTQRDGNGHWLSVELEGFAKGDPLLSSHPGWDRLTDAQLQFCAELLYRGHVQYGYPLQLAGSPSGLGLGYHSMGAEAGANWGHSGCPGEPIKAQLPDILARAQRLAGKPGGRVENRMWQGMLQPGAEKTIICTPYDKSQVSFGTDLGDPVTLRVAEHVVEGPGRPAGWVVAPLFTISKDDKARHDLPSRDGVDRRSVLRVDAEGNALKPGDPGFDTPVGYLAWLP